MHKHKAIKWDESDSNLLDKVIISVAFQNPDIIPGHAPNQTKISVNRNK